MHSLLIHWFWCLLVEECEIPNTNGAFRAGIIPGTSCQKAYLYSPGSQSPAVLNTCDLGTALDLASCSCQLLNSFVCAVP